MKVVDTLTRIGVWLKRFRHRKGYGVHSPFAFGLITRVIYEKYPYYNYSGLGGIRRELLATLPGTRLNREKTDRLLFRLVNRMQPATIVEVGTSSGLTTCYLAAAKEDACCHTFDEQSGCAPAVRQWFAGKKNVCFHREALLPSLQSVVNGLGAVDFLYLGENAWAGDAFEACLPKAGERSLFVVKGIHRSRGKEAWWRSVISDPRTGVTFDLYDIGLVFFDLRKTKQHYIVNF